MKNIQISDRRKFFYDCEFMEEPGYLKLISIAFAGEQGQEFYACNLDVAKEFSRASIWVKNNVIPRLPPKTSVVWMTEERIRDALLNFLRPTGKNPVELWGYFADYDHVLLCWLFGRMVDLPDGMPQYTLDIKQLAYHMGNPELPQQIEGEHNALEDAKHHKAMFEHLMKLNRFDL